MSDARNDVYLEGKYEDFRGFLGDRKYADCYVIITSLREDGFDKEADQLHGDVVR